MTHPLHWLGASCGRRLVALLCALLTLSALATGCRKAPASLILATTTSTQDSGLLDELLPAFESETGIRVKVLAVGSGEALAMGRRGDADVLLVHAPAGEEELMAAGRGLARLAVMHNHFLLVGPPEDPAGVAGTPPAEALARVARSSGVFASRGDDSGTHRKEQALWEKAGLPRTGPPSGLLSTGQGMGATLRIAAEKGAYTLTDRATWLAQKGALRSRAWVEEGDGLLNPYHVIVVAPLPQRPDRSSLARSLAQWLVSPAVQVRIREFGRARFGEPLFLPDALAPSAPRL